MPNEELHRRVGDELSWDPEVDDGAIAVSASDGVVTLRGTVGSHRDKRAAATAARRADGRRPCQRGRRDAHRNR